MLVNTTTETLKTAEVRSGLSRRTLYNLMYDGSIDTVKVRGRRLVISASLTRLLSPDQARAA
jgi:hypothetical protein